MLIKIGLILFGLQFSYELSAQWKISEGLTATSNSQENLSVKNTSRENILDANGNINFKTVLLDNASSLLNGFDYSGFRDITFHLENSKTKPYSYNQESVVWGVYFAFVKKDGGSATSTLWLRANKYNQISGGKVQSRYSYSLGEDWKSFGYDDSYITNMLIKISCHSSGQVDIGFANGPHSVYPFDTQSFYKFTHLTDIAGIQSIQVIVGSDAELSVRGAYITNTTYEAMEANFQREVKNAESFAEVQKKSMEEMDKIMDDQAKRDREITKKLIEQNNEATEKLIASIKNNKSESGAVFQVAGWYYFGSAKTRKACTLKIKENPYGFSSANNYIVVGYRFADGINSFMKTNVQASFDDKLQCYTAFVGTQYVYFNM
jgi:hypothetical protein